MDVRRFVLRASLSCLGVTALSAISLVFLPPGGVAGRFTLSGLCATVAGGLSMPFVRWATRDDARWGGLAGIIFVCTELMLTLTLIWGTSYFPSIDDARVGGTMIDLAIVVVPCLIGAHQLGVKGRSVLGWCALGSGLIALLMFLVDTWSDGGVFKSNADTRLRFWGISLLVSGGAAAMGFVRPRERLRWPLLGMILAVASGALSCWIIKDFPHMSAAPGRAGATDWKIVFTLMAYAYAIGSANLILLFKLIGIPRGVQWATAACAIITATTLTLLMWSEDPQYWTGLSATSIALFCGITAVVLMARFAEKPVLALDRAQLSTIEILCPRCRKRGAIGLGTSACACGLRFKIEVEEPRCTKCDQLLYGLQGDRCTECGTPVSAAAIF